MSDLGVFLWGPKGSGKTSLVYSFCYCMERKYSKGDNDLQFILTHMNGEAINILPPEEIPDIKAGTRTMTRVNLKFSRKLLKEAQTNKEKYSQDISCQEHPLFFFDAPGGQLDQLIDPNIIDKEVIALREEIIRSPNIIVLLDPTLLAESENSTNNSEEQRVRMTQAQYVTKIKNLFELIGDNKQFRRNIAICLSKSDIIDRGMVDHAQMNVENSWHLIRMKFGREMIDSINKHKPHHEIRPFILSSKKEKLDSWNPKGIEWPLFWLFESSEIARITKGISTPNMDLMTRLFSGERLKYYIRYPRPAWEKQNNYGI